MRSKTEIIDDIYNEIENEGASFPFDSTKYELAFKNVMNKVFKTITIESDLKEYSDDERKYSDKEDFLSLSQTIQDEKFYNLNVNQTGNKEKRTLQIMVLDYNEL